jgi:hypothetical protein
LPGQSWLTKKHRDGRGADGTNDHDDE